MSDTPTAWTRTTLGKLGDYHNGRGFKKAEWRSSGRPIIRIQNLTGTSSIHNYFQGEVDPRNVAHTGDLLVSWAATLGTYFWNGPEGVVNQHIFKVESHIDKRFHKYLLDYKLAELMRETHGSGMVHITRGKFDALEVSVPDRDEQCRIVDILEDHLSRLDSAEAHLGRALRRLHRWRRAAEQAVFDQTGGVPTRVERLLAEPMRNGHSARAVRGDSPGVRTLTLTAVTRNDFSDQYTKVTAADPRKVKDLWLEPGDILVQRSNTPQLVGTVAKYAGSRDWAIFPDLLIRLRADSALVHPAYLAAAMASATVGAHLRSKAKGLAGSMPKIDQGTIGATLIPVPRLEAQDRAVVLLESIREQSDRRSEEILRAVAKSVSLRSALMQRAFSGDLTSRAATVPKEVTT